MAQALVTFACVLEFCPHRLHERGTRPGLGGTYGISLFDRKAIEVVCEKKGTSIPLAYRDLSLSLSLFAEGS